jgi:hypothetical protein
MVLSKSSQIKILFAAAALAMLAAWALGNGLLGAKVAVTSSEGTTADNVIVAIACPNAVCAEF